MGYVDGAPEVGVEVGNWGYPTVSASSSYKSSMDLFVRMLRIALFFAIPFIASHHCVDCRFEESEEMGM